MTGKDKISDELKIRNEPHFSGGLCSATNERQHQLHTATYGPEGGDRADSSCSLGAGHSAARAQVALLFMSLLAMPHSVKSGLFVALHYIT